MGGRAGDGPRRRAAGSGPTSWSAQDRDPAAPGAELDRVGGAGPAAGRRGALDAVVPQSGARRTAGVLRPDAHERPNASDHRREPVPVGDVWRPHQWRGSPILPFHRGQGGAFCRQGLAPGLSGTRGARQRSGLSQRHLDVAALRRPAGLCPHNARAGTGRDRPARLCRGIRLYRPPRVATHAGNPGRHGTVPGRPDQRHNRV